MSRHELRPFTESDWDAFAGCESTRPWICNINEHSTVIVDDYIVQFFFDGEMIMTQRYISSTKAYRAMEAFLRHCTD